MTEPQPRIERSEWSPLKTALAMLIGAVLGASVYVVAEARHSKQEAELAAQALPPTAATTLPIELAAAPKAKTLEAPADVSPQPAAAAPEPTVEPNPNLNLDLDPKARALAERSAAEQALLDEARTQLDANNASGAQATLERMKRRFARGSLVEERELLRIEVYKARGQMPAAKRAARKFAKAFPNSTHLGELDALISI